MASPIEIDVPRKIERLEFLAKLALEDKHVTGEPRSKLDDVVTNGTQLSLVATPLETIPLVPVNRSSPAETPFTPIELQEALVYFGRMAIFRALRPLSEQDPFEGTETHLTRETLTRLATAVHRRSSDGQEQPNSYSTQVLDRGVQGSPLSNPSNDSSASLLRDAVARCIPGLIRELRTAENDVDVGLRAAGIITHRTLPPHRVIRLARIQLTIRSKKNLLSTTGSDAAAPSSGRQLSQWQTAARSVLDSMKAEGGKGKGKDTGEREGGNDEGRGEGKGKGKAMSTRFSKEDSELAKQFEAKTRIEIEELNAELTEMEVQMTGSVSQTISESVLGRVLERAERVFELYAGLEVILDPDAMSAVSILNGHNAPPPESEFQLFRRRGIAQQAPVTDIRSYREALKLVDPAETSRYLVRLMEALTGSATDICSGRTKERITHIKDNMGPDLVTGPRALTRLGPKTAAPPSTASTESLMLLAKTATRQTYSDPGTSAVQASSSSAPGHGPGPGVMPALTDNDQFWQFVTGAVPAAPQPPTHYAPTPYKSSLSFAESYVRDETNGMCT